MHRLLKGSLALLAGFSIGTAGLTTANAATWHKGTPKVLRRYWSTKGTSKGKMNWSQFRGTKKGFQLGHMGMPGVLVAHSRYKRVGRTYILTGHAKKNGMYRGGHVRFTMTKSGTHYLLRGEGWKDTLVRVQG